MITVHILDVGHGNCAIVQSCGEVVIIDAGPGLGLLRFVEENSITCIDLLLISHSDYDHIKGAINVLVKSDVKVKQVHLNSNAMQDSRCWDDLLFAIDCAYRRGETHYTPGLSSTDMDKYKCGTAAIQILGPSPVLVGRGVGKSVKIGSDEYAIESNSLSAVVRIASSETPIVLLPGDADIVTLQDMLVDNREANCPILVFPHHGGHSGADAENFVNTLLGLVRPDTIIFSVRHSVRDPKFPRKDVVNYIRKFNSEIRIICTQLSGHCCAELPADSPVHLGPSYASGREQKKCCGGTVVVEFQDAVKIIEPNIDRHAEFISNFVRSPMCIDK